MSMPFKKSRDIHKSKMEKEKIMKSTEVKRPVDDEDDIARNSLVIFFFFFSIKLKKIGKP